MSSRNAQHKRRNQSYNQFGNQKGVALIMVLLAMALIVTLAAGMTQQQSLWIYKASHQIAQGQGKNIAFGAEEFAKQILQKDYEQDREDNAFVDSPKEVWAQYSALVPVDDDGQGIVEVQINDLGGKINLNDLVDSTGAVDERIRDQLGRLLLNLQINDIRPDVFIDWIDKNDERVSAYGAEDGNYLGMETPYRAANQPFTSVTELRLMDGMTEEIYQKLLPYVTALPVSGLGINVNMSPGPVLQSLHENLTVDQIKTILEQRKEKPFENVQDFLALPQFAGLDLQAQGLQVKTFFFEVASKVTYNDRVFQLVTTLFRSSEGEMMTLSRDQGRKNLITKERFTLSDGG